MAAREREYEDDFEEDDRPRRRPRPRPSDEFEEGPPSRRRPRDDFDEEDDRPTRRRRARDEYDDEYEERPRRRRRRDVEEEYAGFWMRLVAVLIDSIIISVVFLPAWFLLGGYGMSPSLLSVFQMVLVLAGWLYEAILVSSAMQGTLGKRVLNIIVTDLDGRPVSFARATGRYFAKLLSLLPCLIGFIMAGFTERKQALHDLIAGTLVLRQEP